ncbi:hypothetical protein XF36_29085 (plasmid) [Pseudonocardia sp. HH130629-09]|nr:hypothetical protein XF36_29085 [Pseudonocardia sp. HH130629-09]
MFRDGRVNPAAGTPGTAPAAVVGIGARYAGGVGSADDLWALLTAGRTTVGEVPDDRWRPYREHSREHAAALDGVLARGSFLDDDVHGFDAAFFGVPGREAEQLDPQQRIALEVAWEALEDARIDPSSLAGTDTAVHLGVGTDDYGRRLVEDLPRVRAWTGIGASLCGVPNRISHALDLRGPSVAVDTACSSSLVAIHQACAALGAGETRLALAGGVMVMSGPGLTAVLGQAGALGPDGRSTPFDAGADGYGRGEGCGVVVLKRLDDARADGDEVLAVIRGGAVRQDGRTEGIMAPSGASQADLLRVAYRAAGVDPATVGYVEAHGTGTPTGDPVEAGALCAVLGRGTDLPGCRVGSVKANVGHTEAAAGVAGLIAAVQVLRHAHVPALPGPVVPRDDVGWAAAGLTPATAPADWPAPSGHPRRAGVASYGYGGTIAHLVLEEAPAQAPGAPGAPPAGVAVDTAFPLSAASPEALAEQARRLAVAVAATPGPDLGDVARTLHHGRAALRHRAVVTAGDRDGLLTGLRALAGGTADPSLATSVAGPRPDAVWVFSGHGQQWAGMGRGLLDTDPDFTTVVDRLAPVYRDELGVTPREVIEADDLGGVDRIQATLCAVQLGLAASWRARGLRPAAVLGHSVGEIAAAATAGVLTEPEAARLVCRRSALLTRAAGHGAMVLVDLAFDDCAADLAAHPGAEAAIAASPASTVIAGDPGAVAAAAARWEGAGRTVRRVDSDVAFHTAQMAPLAAELAGAVADLAPRAPAVTRYTTALDDPRGDHPQDAAYWAENLRNPVRFADAVTAAAEDGHRVFLEVSAHPVVAHSAAETLAAAGVEDGTVVASLRRHRPEVAALAAAAATLWCRGVRTGPRVPDGRRARLPGVAWRHRPYRVEHPPVAPPAPAHTLLGAPVEVPGTGVTVHATTLDERTRPYPGRHPVLGVEIVPAAVTLLSHLHAAGTAALTGVALHWPVVVPAEDGPRRALQVVRDGDALRLLSREPGGRWSLHSESRADRGPATPARLDADAAAEPADPGAVVERLAELGVAAMGFPWRVEKLRRGDGVLVADVAADPDGVLRRRGPAALLDAALSAASVVFDGPAALRMPAALDRVELDVDAATRADRARVVAALDPDRPLTVDVELRGDGDALLGRLDGIRYAEPRGAGRPELAETAFGVRWTDLEPADTPTPGGPPTPGGAAGGGRAAGAPASGPRVAVADGPGAAELAALLGLEVDGSAPQLLVAAPDDPAAAVTTVRDVLHRAVRSGGPTGADGGVAVTLHLVTRGLHDAPGPSTAAAAGVARVLATEHPDVVGGLLDLPADDDGARAAAPALRHLLTTRHDAAAGADGGHAGEPVLAVTPGGLRAPRAVPAPRADDPAPALRPDGTYLVTGGTGAVGAVVAEHLAERGARRIVLLGRTALPPREAWDPADPRVRAVLDVEAAGAAVFPVAADVTDDTAVRDALDALALPPVRGVVHAAGAVRSAPALDLTDDDVRTTVHAKVAGAAALDALFPPGELDFLVLFSSAGPLLGLPGQAAYAAANGALDGLAARRRGAGDRGCASIAWTSWRGLGMARSAAATDVELDARGSADLTPERALAVLDRVLDDRAALGPGPVLALPVRTDHTGPRPSLLDGLAPPPDDDAGGDADWAALSGPELRRALRDTVRDTAAAVLGADAVPGDAALGELGVDSLMGSMLRLRLERATGLALAPTLLWNHPTADAVAAHLAGRLAVDSTADGTPADTDEAATATAEAGGPA